MYIPLRVSFQLRERDTCMCCGWFINVTRETGGGLKHNVHPVDILHINLFFCPYSKQFVPTGGCISYDDAPSINRILRGRGLYWALGS